MHFEGPTALTALIAATPAETEDADFLQLAYEILKGWVELETANRRLAAIDTVRHAEWETNKPLRTGPASMVSRPDAMLRELNQAMPYLIKLGSHFVGRKAPSLEHFGLYLLGQWLAAEGIEGSRGIEAMSHAFLEHFELLASSMKQSIDEAAKADDALESPI